MSRTEAADSKPTSAGAVNSRPMALAIHSVSPNYGGREYFSAERDSVVPRHSNSLYFIMIA